ncbi:hypothetical protein EOA32_36030, partial [Mesorhizobium sp. M1A.F.Ca.ET.072.01.1.1]|uniref:nucleotidyl transferase AbiEii/AbiGii toxin family protein n=1 Tax=Mesorhizobium sp. M1A.F.Ca.ET.072.01.1.1 TaxID=2496753 RepID=UPI000FD41B08
FEWSFGGGTAMMIQIGHRESHDIDVFLDDPQLLGFMDPSTTCTLKRCHQTIWVTGFGFRSSHSKGSVKSTSSLAHGRGWRS